MEITMNKKLLSFLVLGFLISSVTFTSDSISANKDTPGISAELTTMLESASVDWSLVHRTFGYNGNADAATEVTMKPTQSKKKKKGKPKAPVVTVQGYHDPLQGEITTTEQTVEIMQELLKKYSAVVGPLKKEQLNATKKKRFSQDSQNKLTAYEKAQTKVRAIIQNLKQEVGTAKAAEHLEAQQKEAARFSELETDKSARETAQRKERREIERRKIETEFTLKSEIVASPNLGNAIETIIEQALKFGTTERDLSAMMNKISTDPIKACTEIIPHEFKGDDQIRPNGNEIDELFYLFVGHKERVEVHACPVCGTINQTPCKVTYQYDPSYMLKNKVVIDKMIGKLEKTIKVAIEDKDQKMRLVLPDKNYIAPSIYKLFILLMHKGQQNNVGMENTSARSFGKLAYQFRSLASANFIHAEE